MTSHLAPAALAARPRLLLRLQEQLQRARTDSLERAWHLPLLRLALAALVSLLVLATAGGLIASA